MPRAKTNPDVAKLERAGRLLYGEKWQSPLAEAMGVSQTTIALALNGQRPPTEMTMLALVGAIQDETYRMRKAVLELEEIRDSILDD